MSRSRSTTHRYSQPSLAPEVFKNLNTELPRVLTNQVPTIIVLNSVTKIAPNSMVGNVRSNVCAPETSSDCQRQGARAMPDQDAVQQSHLSTTWYAGESQTALAHLTIYCAASLIGVIISQILK